jgi:ABC-type sugar transport system ATPase subunit
MSAGSDDRTAGEGGDDSAADPESAAGAAPGAETEARSPAKIRIEDVTKRFGRIVAVDDVSLDIYEGEIFALIGDNGAGKSTLMNILSGVHAPTEGTVYYEGEPVRFDNPSDAREEGIETVYQDLALMNDLDIASNIFMGQFPTTGAGPLRIIDWEETYDRAGAIVHDRLDRDIQLRTEVQFLSGGERQLVAIARALAFDPEVIVLDEPTSALSIDAAELVHNTIERLKEAGITIVIVSHDMDTVLRLSDRIGVLYRGRLNALIEDPASVDIETLSDLIVGGSR